MLHAVRSGSGPRVVLLHGFSQTQASWDVVGEALAADHEVVAVDLPGHGGSADERLDLPATAAAVAEVGGAGTYIGYSMGGRVALRVALDHPEVVEHLVLISSTAGIRDDEERARRRASDDGLASTIEREGVATFLEHWMAQPLFAGLVPSEAHIAARLTNTPEGLASSLRLAGTGTMDPAWWDELPVLGERGLPVTLVVGERDAKYRGIAEHLAAGIGPTAQVVVLTGAGHVCHLEAPAAFVDALRSAQVR
jgi:2-succinyl-6-hydroxy-2,4-cyclohexadiene-1-carboxylate synthase